MLLNSFPVVFIIPTSTKINNFLLRLTMELCVCLMVVFLATNLITTLWFYRSLVLQYTFFKESKLWINRFAELKMKMNYPERCWIVEYNMSHMCFVAFLLYCNFVLYSLYTPTKDQENNIRKTKIYKYGLSVRSSKGVQSASPI